MRYSYRLPEQLLRLIFELAAIQDNYTAAQLARTSRLVQHWVEGILYSIVSLRRESSSRSFLRTIETTKRPFISASVKSLTISFDPRDDRTPKILLACSAIENLTLYTVPGVFTGIENQIVSWNIRKLELAASRLRPKRMQIHLGTLEELHNPIRRLHDTLFQRVTHLAVLDDWDSWVAWSGFELLPCLTHLSFDLKLGPRTLGKEVLGVVRDAITRILMTCPKLRVCILRVLFHPSGPEGILEYFRDYGDYRLILVRDKEHIFRDREAHSRSEAMMWEFAERRALGSRRRR